MLKPGGRGLGDRSECEHYRALNCKWSKETRLVFVTARLRCAVIQILIQEVQLLAFLVSLGGFWV